ncbi:MAG: pyridoxal phosphate-dependent aminotransferase [Thermodesulfobacteriota bacterium]|nr:pyridoxal phosphate-dependent aminotransferase [Thermodesulfobacteriota bacterium]
MIVSRQMMDYSKASSWIRKMFEEGARLKAEYGMENVFDFSLGNPDVPPPKKVIDVMGDLASDINTGHGYMPNAGYPQVRKAVAGYASNLYRVELSPDDIVMSCGAGGGINVILKSIIAPGDEVMVISPYFVEYGFYVENHGGVLVAVECDADFLPDLEKIKKAITERTKAIIINSPNNPTGRVYPEKILTGLQDVLAGHPDILVISDEPYRRLVYDNLHVPSILKILPKSVVVTSFSKELSLAGERIGYIAAGAGIAEKDRFIDALILATRILGFVNAPALMQRVLGQCIHLSVDIDIYKRRRDLLRSILDDMDLSYAPPEGAFYLFVKSPIADDLAFSNALLKEKILVVPGRGFGYKGYVRFAYCVDEATIEGAAPGLKRAVASLGEDSE